ncbi:hypothetical protein F5888DRAFT_1808592 [Russula emetica]|nr:hypothetical protein F5888DRAFT_1808592 [Russula emetica]
MSDVSNDPSIASPKGRLSPMAPPLSPSTAAVGLQLDPHNPNALMHIAQGLLATIRKREADYRIESNSWCEQMAAQKIHFEEALAHAQPTETAPEGYVLNIRERAPNFVIPIQDGCYQPAWWVKQLPDSGCDLVCLKKRSFASVQRTWQEGGASRGPGGVSHSPDETPYIGKVYAECDGDDEDENHILSLPPWLLALLKGSASVYNTLAQEVRNNGDWPLQAEVSRFRELEISLLDVRLCIDHLQAEQRGMREAQESSRVRLEMARLDRKVSNLRAMSPDVRNRGFKGRRSTQFRGNMG